MAELRPAAEMKDSGIEWIGQIPRDWRVVPLLALLVDPEAMRDGPFGSDLKNEEYTETGIPVVQLGAIQDGKFEENKLHFISEAKADALIRHNALPHDIVIAKMMPAGKAAILPEKYPRYVVSADVIKATIIKDYWSRWLIYALNSYGITQCDIQSQGATRARININKAKRIKIALPNDNDALYVLNHLDVRCSKIDEIIAEATASIEEYKELKQAVIFEAVTKGLDKSVPMKESGDSWIGLCPVHYQIGQLSMLSTIVRGGSPRPAGDPRYYGGDIPFMRISDITRDEEIYVNYCVHTITEEGFSRTREVPPYTLLLTNSGATLGVPKITTFKTTFNDGIAAFLNIDDRLDIMFAYYYLKARTSFFLESASMGMGQPNLNTDIIGRTHIVLPPKEEQLRIVEYLKNKCESMNAIISEKQSLISDLQAYKKSLIYEVVTGKRRVV